MGTCIKCFSDSWMTVHQVYGMTTHECTVCGNTLERETPVVKAKLTDSDNCRKCNTPTLKWNSGKLNSKRAKKAFHFCKWLKCTTCRTVYFDDDFKTYPGTTCECVRTISSTPAKNTLPLKNYLMDV